MENVKTPFVANSFYFCDPDGRTDYVQNRSPLPVDERTPYINRLVFENVDCTDCHAAAAFFIGLPERKINEIVMRNVSVSFAKEPVPFVPAMLCGVDGMAGKGILAENVHSLVLDNVSLSGQSGQPCELVSIAAGTGEMDYTEIMRFIKKDKPYIHVSLENTTPENAETSRKFIESVWEGV